MRAAIVFLVTSIVAAMPLGGAAAQMNQVTSYGFKNSTAPARTIAKSGGLKAPRVANFAPLTKEECVGLGGKVHIHLCTGRMGLACTTVDQHGVVRTECINK